MGTSASFQQPSDFLNKLRSAFYIMVGIPLPFFLTVYLLSRKEQYEAPLPDIPGTLLWVVPVICVLITIAAYWRYEKALKAARQQATLPDKLQAVWKASLDKFVWLESATGIVTIIYVLSGHIVYAGAYIGMLILFAMSNPTVYSVISDLKLPRNEKEIMLKNKPFSQ